MIASYVPVWGLAAPLARAPNPSASARRWRRLSRTVVMLLACAGTPAFAQERVSDELLLLRMLLASERARV